MENTTSTDIRRSNIRLLIHDAGGIGAMARKLRISKQELTALISKHSNIRIRSWYAREIETKLGLELGWLDASHDHISSEARRIAKKWQTLPSNLRIQVKNYIDLQLESLDLDPDYDDDFFDLERDNTDFKQIYNFED